MRITKRRLRRIIREQTNDPYQMSTPEQRRAPDEGTGTMEDAARLLSGILDDWVNNPEMNHSVGDQFRKRLQEIEMMLELIKT